jgi:hypothetical protein
VGKRLSEFLCLVAAVIAPPAAIAYETDQHTHRGADIADSTAVLNAKVNETIAGIVADWDKGHDEIAMVDAFYRELGGRHWVDRLERWAMKSPDVERLEVGRYESIFADQPFYATRVAKLFGTGATIRVNEQLIGSDKIGHFISQGRKYYKRYLKYGSEEAAAEQSAFTERAIFGQLSNGIYSNADLVANYEGHRFYRSLFEDGIIPGKQAILRWEAEEWIIQRDFDWADHVNEYWDEALNVNHFDSTLYKHMHDTFVDMCPQYWERPDLYTIVNEDVFIEKYAHLQLRDTSELRLDSLCPVQAFLDGDTSKFVTPAGKSSPGVPASP